MTERWTIRRVLGWTGQHFEKRGVDDPRLTAEILLAHALRVDRVRLYVDLDRPLDRAELTDFRGLVARRADGEPTQYLTGRRDFYGRSFRVDPRVLIPRPETELLVESVLRALPRDAEARVLDVGTGSGCIAVTLAAERPRLSVRATDLSEDAASLARDNAAAHGVEGRVRVQVGDLFDPLAAEGPFNVVVSNPPYVTRSELATLSEEVRREPRVALDGGPDGLEVIRRIVRGAAPHLVPGGLLAMEIGETHGAAVRSLLSEGGYGDVRIEADLERRDRMAFGTR